MMVEVNKLSWVRQIQNELYKFGVRLGETPPKVLIKKTNRGGVKITSTTPLTHVSENTIKEVAKEFKYANAEVVIKENITLERLIDAFAANRIYPPHLVVINKIDLVNGLPVTDKKSSIFISVEKRQNISSLKKAIWEKLSLIRIYLKPQDGKVDLNEPLIVRAGLSLKEILDDFAFPNRENVKKAKVYGPGAKFPGQEVSFRFKPQEGTIVSFL